jgi:ABC-type lipoprotein export system ATPase subunit
MVTHSREYARRATRAIHLFDGRIVDDRASAIPTAATAATDTAAA